MAIGGVWGMVFKLKRVVLGGFGVVVVGRRQVIRDFTTRKHFLGRHGVRVLVNGEGLGIGEFEISAGGGLDFR
jgi:hypothetical protein